MILNLLLFSFSVIVPIDYQPLKNCLKNVYNIKELDNIDYLSYQKLTDWISKYYAKYYQSNHRYEFKDLKDDNTGILKVRIALVLLLKLKYKVIILPSQDDELPDTPSGELTTDSGELPNGRFVSGIYLYYLLNLFFR